MNPFLAEDDVGDDWLDDDIISKNPKRRKTTNYSTANYSNSVDTRNISLRLRHEHREPKPFDTETSIADIASDTEELNISSTSLSRKLSSSSVKRKSQTTLKDAGFTRRKSNDSVKSMASNWSSDCLVPDETTPKKYEEDSTSFSTQTKYGSTIMAINIHINNKIWRIPIQLRLLPNLTISSLAEEAAQRYYG